MTDVLPLFVVVAAAIAATTCVIVDVNVVTFAVAINAPLSDRLASALAPVAPGSKGKPVHFNWYHYYQKATTYPKPAGGAAARVGTGVVELIHLFPGDMFVHHHR